VNHAARRRALRRAAVALSTMAILPAAAASPAAAAPRHAKLCVERATLRDTPGGFAVGYVYRPATVTVLASDPGTHYTRVRLKTRRGGWIPTSALCHGGDRAA
jgi:hypothetical protein